MRGAILACGLGLFLAGCNLDPAKSCSSDSDCGAGVCGSQTHTCLASECPSACGANLACVKRACAEVHTSVAITASPEDRGHVGHSVTLTAQLTPPSTVTHVDPAQLSISASDGTDPAESITLNPVQGGADGLYRGTWAPQHDGATYQLTVDPSLAIDGGVSLTAKFMGPQLSLAFGNPPAREDSAHQDPAMTNPYRRDEHAILNVRSTDDLAPGSLHVSVAGTDGQFAQIQVNSDSQCDAGWCGMADIDLFKPAMGAFRTTFPVLVVGQDTLGNSSVLDAGIDVTRWKWQVQSPDGRPFSGSPAVGSSGEILLGTAIAALGEGSLVAVSPDGRIQWSIDGGAVVASPAIGSMDAGGFIYVGFNRQAAWGDYTQISALELSNGGVFVSCFADGGVQSAPAISNATYVGTPSEVAFFVTNATANGNDKILRPNDSSTSCLGATSGRLNAQSAVVTLGADYFFPKPNARILQHVALADTGVGMIDSLSVPAFVQDLAIVDGGLVATAGEATVGLEAFAPDGGSAWVPDGGQTLDVTFGALVDAQGNAFFTDPNVLASAPLYAGQISTVPTQPSGSYSSIILGSDHELYEVSASGIEVRNQDLSLRWTDSSLQLGSVSTAPALDCSRDAGVPISGAPGVLYVAAQNGLYSFVVDSRGIDTTAPWPKYQHDPRNTGNANTDLSEFACP